MTFVPAPLSSRLYMLKFDVDTPRPIVCVVPPANSRVDVPIVIFVPSRSVISPYTFQVCAPIEIVVRLIPVATTSQEDAVTSIVAVPAPLLASNTTGLVASGTDAPLAPPDDADQCVVDDHTPVPPTQKRFAPEQPTACAVGAIASRAANEMIIPIARQAHANRLELIVFTLSGICKQRSA